MIGRVEALSKCQNTLHDLWEEMRAEKERERETDVEHERLLYILALQSVIELGEDLGWNHGLMDPFAELLTGINDLNKGARVPLLMHRKLSNRPPPRDQHEMTKGRVVAIQERLIAIGIVKDVAAQRIFRGLGPRAMATLKGGTEGQTTHRTISKWRERCGEADPDSPFRSGFNAHLAVMDDERLLISAGDADVQLPGMLKLFRKHFCRP